MISIMHRKSDKTCYLCMAIHLEYSTQSILEEHHVIYGKGKRTLSEKYGLKVYLCPNHHRDSIESVHHNTANNLSFDCMLKQKAQQAFEERYPKLSFIEIFGKNYIKNRINPKCESNLGQLDGFIELEDEIDDRSKGMANL